MSIKKLVIASMGLFAGLTGIISAQTTDAQRPDVWRLSHTPINAAAPLGTSTETVVIDHDGDFLPGRALVQDIGASSQPWNNVYTGGITVSSGIVNMHESFVDLSSGNATGARAGGLLISTANLIAGGSTYVGEAIVQSSGAPRNIIIVSSTVQVGASTTTLIGSATFYGYDGKGNFVSEMIRFSSRTIPISSTVTMTETNPVLYYGVGNVAFAYISSFTIQITSMTDAFGESTEQVRIMIGWGQKIGLANDLQATGDVYKVTQTGGSDVTIAASNPSLGINTDYDTIVFPTLPNGASEYQVWYTTKKSP
jgi:hypothetical protein